MSSVTRPRGQLKRSRSNRVVAGVCAGLARYFEVDPVLVRLLFVVMAFAQGAGVVLYLVLLLVLPEEDAAQPAAPLATGVAPGRPEASPAPDARASVPRRGLWAGLLLVGLGAYLLVMNLGFFWWWDWKLGGPAMLIAAGLALLFWRLR